MSKNLLAQFNKMENEPIMEIECAGEWHIFYINANNKGIEAGSYCNNGFMPIDSEELFIEWDENYSLDYHLQELYDSCYEYIIR